MTTENTILLTGQEREDYIAKHFAPGMVVPDELMIEDKVSPEFRKAQQDFAEWYDGKSEDEQELIDAISDRTCYIIDEEQYDDFIEMLDDEGITTAEDFEDRFERESDGYGERVFAEFSEELMSDCGYTIEPEWIRNCIDWEMVWHHTLRYDYVTIEFNNNTYFFRNN